MTWRALAAFVAGVLLILAFSCCASAPQVTNVVVPHLGGPGYRVMDADRIDSYEALPALMRAHNDAQNCSKSFRPFNEVEVYAATKIVVKNGMAWTDRISGLTVGHRIYIRHDLDIISMTWVLKHEFVHFVTSDKHPDIDPIMKICGVHYEATP